MASDGTAGADAAQRRRFCVATREGVWAAVAEGAADAGNGRIGERTTDRQRRAVLIDAGYRYRRD